MIREERLMAMGAAFGPVLKAAFPDVSAAQRMAVSDALAEEVEKRAHWFAANHAVSVGEPWPGYTADMERRRIVTLAKLGQMLSVMAGGEVPEVNGYDAGDLFAEVLMSLGIEDAEFPDIALQVVEDDPEGYFLTALHPIDSRAAQEKGV